MTEKALERIVPSCVEALESYQQADEDGIMVLTSRQAIHETIDAYWARVGTCEELAAERDALAAEVERLRGATRASYDHLMNLQPHIPQACKQGHEPFIDSHVDEAMRILLEALKEEKKT